MKTREKIQKPRFADLPRDYAGLVALLPPRPIHDAAELGNASEIIFELAGHDLTVDQADYLEALSMFVEQYEEENVKFPKKAPSGLDCLRHLLEESQMTAADLARLLGVHRSLGAMILRGERQLTVGHIKVLSKRFGVSGSIFL